MSQLPIRRVAALSVSATCTYMAFSIYFYNIAQQEIPNWGWGAPPPAPAEFVEAALAIPGLLAGLPLIMAGSWFGPEWVAQLGIIFGTTFFWYGVGWHIDRARGLVKKENPPGVVAVYMSGLRIFSVIFLPVGAFAGLRVGVHFCANGAPPPWSEVLMYGIVMIWLTLGAFFAWKRLVEPRRRQLPSISPWKRSAEAALREIGKHID